MTQVVVVVLFLGRVRGIEHSCSLASPPHPRQAFVNQEEMHFEEAAKTVHAQEVCTLGKFAASRIRAVTVSEDAAFIVSGSNDGHIFLWDCKTLELKSGIIGHLGVVTATAISLDKRTIVSCCGRDYIINIWRNGKGCLSHALTLSGHTKRINSLAISSNGKLIVSGSDDYTVKLWNLAAQECRKTLIGHLGYISSVAISGDGSFVTSSSGDGTAKVWDVATGKCRGTLIGHTHQVTAVDIGSNGMIFTGSSDRTIKVWDETTLSCIATLNGHNKIVTCVAVSRDATFIVSGGSDRLIKIWCTSTLECQATFIGSWRWPVYSVAVSAGGDSIVSGIGDDTLVLCHSVTLKRYYSEWTLTARSSLRRCMRSQSCHTAMIAAGKDLKLFMFHAREWAIVIILRNRKRKLQRLRHNVRSRMGNGMVCVGQKRVKIAVQGVLIGTTTHPRCPSGNGLRDQLGNMRVFPIEIIEKIASYLW